MRRAYSCEFDGAAELMPNCTYITMLQGDVAVVQWAPNTHATPPMVVTVVVTAVVTAS
jgi:hypothetical protein